MSLLRLREQRIEPGLVEPANQAAVEHGGRGDRAQAKAIDRLQRYTAVRGGRTHLDAEPRRGVRGERIATGRLAGLRAAQLEHVTAGRRAAKVMIKSDDPVHFGAG